MPKAAPAVAILDDEPDMRRALRRLLACHGFQAVEFERAEDLLTSLDTRTPDCLLLDLHMPGMNAFDVLAHLRTRAIPVPTVVITAHDEPGSAERVMELGAAACLKKPVDKETLLAAIEAAAAGKQHIVHSSQAAGPGSHETPPPSPPAR
jgi:FixJ family two-component response regulator